MIFNNVLFALRELCFEKAEKYHAEYQLIGGKRFCGYLVLEEIAFKLSMLVDKEFEDFDKFKETVKKSIDVHYNYYLSKQLTAESEEIVSSANKEFLECLESVTANTTPKEQEYYRVIHGCEAEAIVKRFGEVWHYDKSYWFPLEQIPEDIPEFLFVDCEIVEKYWDSVCAIIRGYGERFYAYGESLYPLDYCEETEKIHFYAGTEHAYTDKAFSNVIYFSHEHTVSFAGNIVSKIKELMRAESEFFNKWIH